MSENDFLVSMHNFVIADDGHLTEVTLETGYRCALNSIICTPHNTLMRCLE